MDIAIHLGAHCTDSTRLLRTLLRNRDHLSPYGVSVPGPGRYRDVLGQVMNVLRGEPATGDTRDVVLESVLEGDEPARLILSNPNFISMPAMSVDGRHLYPKAHKTAWLRNVFPDNPVALYLAIRNPATFIPALYGSMQGAASFEDFSFGFRPSDMRWSETVERIRAACPDCPLTVWCHEDSPLIWGEISQALAGVDEDAGLHGGFDLLRQIMSNEGMQRLRAYTKGHPPSNQTARRRVMGAFLDKFGLEDEMEEEIDLPGWTEDLVARMTETYEADLGAIAAQHGVTLLRA